MRRGRPAMRDEFRQEILEVLSDTPYPVTVTTIKKKLDQRRPRPCGRDTVHKYIQELVTDRLVLRRPLPARQGHKPLLVYLGRGMQNP